MGKLKKVVLIAGGAAAAFGISIFGGVIFRHVESKNYNNYVVENISSEDQVKILLTETNADDGFLDKMNTRLLNNGDKPVYVSFDDNFYKEENKMFLDVSKKVLDTYFDIVHDINDKYTYEVIPRNESLKKNKKEATINFQYEEIEGAMAQVIIPPNSSQRTLIINSNDKFDEYVLEKTLVHEAAHLFNIGDIYDIDYMHADTAVDTKYRDGSKAVSVMPTPNDYACLLSMFTPNMSKVELAKFIKEIPNKLEKYNQRYYDVASKEMNEAYYSDFMYPTDFTNGTFSLSFGEYNTGFLDIEITDNTYYAKVLNLNKEVISECDGKIYKTKNFIFMHDMYFPYGLEERDIYYSKPHRQSLGICDWKTYNKYNTYLFDIAGRKRFDMEKDNMKNKTNTNSYEYDFIN